MTTASPVRETLDAALGRATPAATAAVRNRIAAISSMPDSGGRLRGLMLALEVESRLEAELWDEFIVETASRNHETDSDYLAAIRLWSYTRQLRGPDAIFLLPLIRVRGRNQLIRDLSAQTSAIGAPIGVTVARSIVSDMMDPVRWTLAVDRAAVLGLRMARYLMWATFDDPSTAAPRLRGRGADLVACELGLDDEAQKDVHWAGDRPLVLLEYEPGANPVLIPTVIEAFGSDPTNYYFAPAPRGQDRGWTRPWAMTPSPVTHPRPEVVHAPLEMTTIVRAGSEEW